MGLMWKWLEEMGDMAGRMSGGEPRALLGLRRRVGRTRRGSGRTGDGGPPGAMPADVRQKLLALFHREYGRYPETEYELQQWVLDRW